MNVLLIDDDRHILDLLQKMIPWKDLGYRVTGVAVTGEDALRMVESAAPDLVISDLKMPTMDGITFSKRFLQYRDDIPVIFLTAYGDMETMQQAMKARNVIDFILKPLSGDKIEYLCSILRENQVGYDQKTFFTQILRDRSLRDEITSRLKNSDGEWFDTFFSRLENCDSCRYQLVSAVCESLLHLLYEAGVHGAPVSEEPIALAELRALYAKAELIRYIAERYLNTICMSGIGRPSTRNMETAAKTKAYIDQNFISPLFDLSAIAAQMHYSPIYLNRIFTQTYNETVKSYLDRLRFEHALLLLKNDRVSISEVALKSGYSNQNYFARIFKAHMHLTPSDYRARLLLVQPVTPEEKRK